MSPRKPPPPTPSIFVSNWDEMLPVYPLRPTRPPPDSRSPPQIYYRNIGDDGTAVSNAGMSSDLYDLYYLHRVQHGMQLWMPPHDHDLTPYDADDEDPMSLTQDPPPNARDGNFPEGNLISGAGRNGTLPVPQPDSYEPNVLHSSSGSMYASANLPLSDPAVTMGSEGLFDGQFDLPSNMGLWFDAQLEHTPPYPPDSCLPLAASRNTGMHEVTFTRADTLTLDVDISPDPSTSPSASSTTMSQQPEFRDNGFLLPPPASRHYRTHSTSVIGTSYANQQSRTALGTENDDFGSFSRGRGHLRTASLPPQRRRPLPYDRPDSGDIGELSSSAVELSSGAHSGSEEAHSPSEESIARLVVANKNVQKANHARRKHPAKFSCSICGSTFTTKWSYQRHNNSHMGERAHRCSVEDCEDAFYNVDDCKRHEQSQHGFKRNKGKSREV